MNSNFRNDPILALICIWYWSKVIGPPIISQILSHRYSSLTHHPPPIMNNGKRKLEPDPDNRLNGVTVTNPKINKGATNLSVGLALHHILLHTSTTYDPPLDCVVLQCEVDTGTSQVYSPYWCVPMQGIGSNIVFPIPFEADVRDESPFYRRYHDWFIMEDTNIQVNCSAKLRVRIYPISVVPPVLLESFLQHGIFVVPQQYSRTFARYNQLIKEFNDGQVPVISINAKHMAIFPTDKFTQSEHGILIGILWFH